MDSRLIPYFRIQDITIKSLPNGHSSCDFADDVRLHVQVIVGSTVILRTEMEKEPTGQVWRLKDAVKLSVNTPPFSIMVMRKSASEGHDQLGSIELDTAKILSLPLAEKKGFSKTLTKDNEDSPALELMFNVVDTLIGLHGYEDVSLILRQMLAAKRKVDLNLVSALCHEVLLLSITNMHRAPLLKKLDDIDSKCHNVAFPSAAELNQAVFIYDKAIKDCEEHDPMKAAYLNDLGSSLLDRFDQLSIPLQTAIGPRPHA